MEKVKYILQNGKKGIANGKKGIANGKKGIFIVVKKVYLNGKKGIFAYYFIILLIILYILIIYILTNKKLVCFQIKSILYVFININRKQKPPSLMRLSGQIYIM